MGRSVERAERGLARGRELHGVAGRCAGDRDGQAGEQCVALLVVEVDGTARRVDGLDRGGAGVVREPRHERVAFEHELGSHHAPLDKSETVVREGRCRLHREGDSGGLLPNGEAGPHLRRVIGASEQAESESDDQALQGEPPSKTYQVLPVLSKN